LDEDHLFRYSTIGGPAYLAAGGAGGGKQTLKLKAIDEIGVVSPAILAQTLYRVKVIACGHHDSPYLLFPDLFLLLEIDSLYRAEPSASAAFAPLLKVDTIFPIYHRLVGHRLR
jgi:hypothetical protein